MKMKLASMAMLAVLLAFGFAFTSCGGDDELTPQGKAAIPPELRNIYDFSSHLLVLTANGNATLNREPCIVIAEGNILTITKDGQTITVMYSIAPDGKVSLSNPSGPAGALLTAFEAIVLAGAVKPGEVGKDWLYTTWGNVTWGSTTYPSYKYDIVFFMSKTTVDAGTNNGYAVNTASKALDIVKWDITDTTIELSLEMGIVAGVDYGTLICTYDWKIDQTGKLKLSNAVSGSTYGIFLEPYSTFPALDGIKFGTKAEYGPWDGALTPLTGTWNIIITGTTIPIFKIAETGAELYSFSQLKLIDAEYLVNSAGKKLIINSPLDLGSGFIIDRECMFDFSISNGQLMLRNPVPVDIYRAGVILSGYTGYSPYTKE
jgi:hypothetical protein